MRRRAVAVLLALDVHVPGSGSGNVSGKVATVRVVSRPARRRRGRQGCTCASVSLGHRRRQMVPKRLGSHDQAAKQSGTTCGLERAHTNPTHGDGKGARTCHATHVITQLRPARRRRRAGRPRPRRRWYRRRRYCRNHLLCRTRRPCLGWGSCVHGFPRRLPAACETMIIRTSIGHAGHANQATTLAAKLVPHVHARWI